MRGCGIVLVILGGGALLFVNWIVGAAMIVIGLLMMIVGKSSPGALPTCSVCGNPVVPTSALCPTCHTPLIPTEGPLAPKPAARELGKPPSTRQMLISLGVVILVAVLLVAIVMAANAH